MGHTAGLGGAMAEGGLNGEGDKMPRHVALIMDGNRRYAEARRMPAVYGHSKLGHVRVGVAVFETPIRFCAFDVVDLSPLFVCFGGLLLAEKPSVWDLGSAGRCGAWIGLLGD